MNPQTLSYGLGGSITIQPKPNAELTFFSGPAPTAGVDAVTAVKQAVDAPIEFPPLQHALVAGDKIAIAADPETPQLREVLAGLVQYLVESGASPGDIAIVTANDGVQQEKPIQGVAVHLHQPDVQDSLSYLAASKEGEAIYVNRMLFDADMVLSVGPLRFDDAHGSFGELGGFFPLFSDSKTINRFRRPDQTRSHRQHEKRSHEADEAAWLLGVQFAIQVAADSNNNVQAIVAGHSQAVNSESQHHLKQWRFEPPRRAEMVVAGITGDASQQTWQTFSRALAAAAEAVEDNGAIVLCTELNESVGAGFSCLTDAEEDLEQVESADAFAAALLRDAASRAHVYLLSNLDPQLVENWGAAPVDDPQDIDRLAKSFQSCIVLQGAQHAWVRISDPAAIDA